MSELTKAVFLSYASQDADAVQRICDALRTAGLEVWFDRNELRGGDAWDASIRKQIKECALFMPVISANTNARSEGYFRLEWKLAIDRSHLIADDQPFLLPVMIDDTPEAMARVPDRFRERQWSRLVGGETPAAFAERVKRLLSGAAPAIAVSNVKPVRRSRVLIATLIILAAATAAGLYIFSHRSSSKASPSSITPAPAIQEKSIAVLPFENRSEDKANAYFADGIQEEILTRLAKIADLKVISRTSTQQYQSNPGNLSEIAKQLGVANILEGSVQKVADQVRVNVQLIQAASDSHLWAESFDRQLTDIFRIESDIANTIAETLQAKLTGSEKIAVSARPTENQEAYQLYLKGRFFWNKRTAIDLRKSIEYFNQAIARDPNYALAYAALAQAWLLLPAYDGGAPKDCFPQAEAAAKKALALDDNSSDAHAALGMVKQIYDFDLPGAIAEFERAIQLNPNDAMAHHWLSNHSLPAAGQTERAIAEMKRALELDPLSLIINVNLGQAYINANRYNEAIAQLRKMIEMEGSFYIAHQMLGEALDLKGQIPEAIAEYQKAIALNDDPIPKALLGHLYGRIGRKDQARQILEELRQTREQRYIEAYGLAIVYLGLGDRNETFNWLEQGYRDRDGYYMAIIRIDPVLASLHGDPRFEALAEKIVPAREFAKAASPAP